MLNMPHSIATITYSDLQAGKVSITNYQEMKETFLRVQTYNLARTELVRTFYLMVARVSFILNQPFLPVEIEQRSKTTRALYFIYETEKHYYLQNY